MLSRPASSLVAYSLTLISLSLVLVIMAQASELDGQRKLALQLSRFRVSFADLNTVSLGNCSDDLPASLVTGKLLEGLLGSRGGGGVRTEVSGSGPRLLRSCLGVEISIRNPSEPAKMSSRGGSMRKLSRHCLNCGDLPLAMPKCAISCDCVMLVR